MKQEMRRVLRASIAAATSSGTQNFLGAPWVENLVRLTPRQSQESLALFLISLSPHYFYDSDRRAEAERNRTSREGIVRDVLCRHLRPTSLAIDFGCGPGYMAAAVAPHVRVVEAIDVSRGVLACARVLNPAPNIVYETPSDADRRTEQVDIAYSFAVVQHLTDEIFRSVLNLLRRRLRPGGQLLIHFPIPDDAWRTESEWKADLSMRGRAKLRFGLNCFGGAEDHVIDLVVAAGFKNPRTDALDGATVADLDISRQRLLVASG